MEFIHCCQFAARRPPTHSDVYVHVHVHACVRLFVVHQPVVRSSSVRCCVVHCCVRRLPVVRRLSAVYPLSVAASSAVRCCAVRRRFAAPSVVGLLRRPSSAPSVGCRPLPRFASVAQIPRGTLRTLERTEVSKVEDPKVSSVTCGAPFRLLGSGKPFVWTAIMTRQRAVSLVTCVPPVANSGCAYKLTNIEMVGKQEPALNHWH